MAKQPRKTTALNAAKSKRRRLRAPALVILRLRTDVEANDHHPLGQMDPTLRNEQRETLIASILARLANGPSAKNSESTDPL